MSPETSLIAGEEALEKSEEMFGRRTSEIKIGKTQLPSTSQIEASEGVQGYYLLHPTQNCYS